MNDGLEEKGWWYLPDAPDRRFPGTLHFSQESGAKLDLMGSLDEFDLGLRAHVHPVIVGDMVRGSGITITNSVLSNLKHTMGGETSAEYIVDEIFVGPQYTQLESIRFKEIWVEYSQLSAWAQLNPWYVGTPRSTHSVTIRYTPPQPVPIANLAACDLFLETQYTAQFPGATRDRASIDPKTGIRFSFREETPWADCLRELTTFQQFLTLGVTEPAYPLSIEGLTSDYMTAPHPMRRRRKRKSIPIYYQIQPPPKPERTVDPYNMLFTLPSASPNITAIYGRFHELNTDELLRPSIALYSTTHFSPMMFLEARFLTLMQALESYHRRMIGGTRMRPRRFQQRLEIINNALRNDPNAASLENWLSDALTFANEPRLQDRLLNLVGKLDDLANFIPNRQEFARQVAATRNFLTHYDERRRAEAATGSELSILTRRVRLLLEICLLRELGFTHNNIRRLTEQQRARLALQ